ncbi:MAG TPA: TonB-dependent receptor [Rhizomicrobium sp.]|jgi:iron complex outermembrane receptor protein
MPKTLLRTFLLATVTLPTLLTARAAIAENAGVETVVVTAERRSELIYNVPATITAISGDQIKNLGYTDMKSVIALVPNAVLPDDSENFETFINIRGVHQADINAEPNFGLYRNGIFNGGVRGNLGSQIDIARVEVLSGPQSGLYGRDAVGGVVNVVYATPKLDDNSGYVTGDYGNYERSEIQGAINLPLGNDLALRATGWWINQNEGQLFNPTLDRYIDAHRDLGGRLSAKWEPTSQLSFLWMAELEDVHGPSFTAYAPNGIGGVFNVNCCGLPVEPPETLHTIRHDTPDTEHWQQFYLSQDINYDTESWMGTFELQGAYRNYVLHLQEDQDHTAFSPATNPMMIQQIQLRDEQLHNGYGQLIWKSPDDQRLTWMAGVDYFDETFRFDREFVGTINFNLLNNPAFGPGFTYANLLCSFLMAGNPTGSYNGGCEGTPALGFPGLPGAGANGQFPYNVPNIGLQSGGNAFGAPGSGINSMSVSGFGTATYKLTDALSITGDLRWDQTRKYLTYRQGAIPGFGATALGTSYLTPLFEQIFVPYTDIQADTYVNLAPSVTVQYKLNDDANLYATYATGFRAGSFNLGTSSPQFLSFKPEKDSNYEIGAKTLWLDGTLGINGDVFYMLQSNLVEPQTDPVEPAFIGLYYLANVGEARTYGAELSAVYQANDWLNLGTTIGYLNDRINKGTTHGQSLVGQEIPLTRDWTLDFTAGVNKPISAGVNFVADANWKLEYGGYLPASISNLLTTRYQDLDKLDIDAGVLYDDTRIVLYANNAFDSVIPQFQYSDGVENVNLGRTYGIRIQKNF